ncbi:PLASMODESMATA CALLOSE-BINDING PROTEIN 3-like [Quillaja saponaria]|uniref:PLASMODESMATA CALLOSE-BINDING PROTEIN 3-like n=1 Tax=Quillaja saponaria TaxID=32244 RepID=A0AAD7PIT1_QUISA|nr:PLASMODESMATA CALLOSE-BINDING PROTEIN 3-like [Quillaja saponaria]
MAALALVVLLLAMTGHSSATWCVCKGGLGDAVLQKTLDYACGAGADCGPTHQGGGCFNPNTVKSHCDYAVNSYFQKKGQAQGSCDFSGTASISTSDPSIAGCSFPSSASNAGTSTTPGSTTTTPSTTPPSTTTPSTTTPSTTTPSTTTPSTTTPSTTTPSTTTPSTTSPYSTTPSTGVLGGINGLGPSGAGINTDDSHGGLKLVGTNSFSYFCVLFSGWMMLWWG